MSMPTSFRLPLLAATAVVAAADLASAALPAQQRGSPCSGSCRSVGPAGTGCDFSTIQAAINFSGVAAVRVVSGTFAENLAITDKSLALEGGYANCTDAEAGNDPTGRTTLAPASGRAVHMQQTGTAAQSVLIRNFSIAGNSNSEGAGIRYAGNPAVSPRNTTLNLFDSIVRNNAAANPTRGGGIFVEAGELVLGNSRVIGNQASFGAGIACVDATVLIGGDSYIGQLGSANSAAFGGGLHVGDGCEAAVLGNVLGNTAQFSGGGAYVVAGGKLYVGLTDGANRALFFGNAANTGNLANYGGGAIAATGSNALIDIASALFSLNRAGSSGADNVASGGAIAVRNGASLSVRRPLEACWDPVACAIFSGNRDAARGTAIYAETDGVVRIGEAIFRGQRAEAPASVVESVRSSGTTIIENSYFFDNGSAAEPAANIVRFAGAAGVLRSSVIADNVYSGAAVAADLSTVDILGVTVWEPGRAKVSYTGGTPTPLVRCAHADSPGWPAGAVSTSTGDPIFRQRGDDYRVFPSNGSRFSPVVDRCLTAYLSASDGSGAPSTDAAGNFRLIDLAVFPNTPGPIDIGPQEVLVSTGDDLIFRYSFERE